MATFSATFCLSNFYFQNMVCCGSLRFEKRFDVDVLDFKIELC